MGADDVGDDLGDDPVTQLCADGYSGWGGVARRGCQPGSAFVRWFPSVSPAGIAVAGRQYAYVYFASQQASTASAITV